MRVSTSQHATAAGHALGHLAEGVIEAGALSGQSLRGGHTGVRIAIARQGIPPHLVTGYPQYIHLLVYRDMNIGLGWERTQPAREQPVDQTWQND